MSIVTTAIGGTDHHSGFYEIVFGIVVIIALHKQMAVFGDVHVDGTLVIEGQLILEP